MKYILVVITVVLLVGCEENPVTPAAPQWAAGNWSGHFYADSVNTPAMIHSVTLHLTLADGNQILPVLSCAGPLLNFSEIAGFGTVSANSVGITCASGDVILSGTLQYFKANDIGKNDILTGYIHDGPREYIIRLSKVL